jgi:hypothetical protein
LFVLLRSSFERFRSYFFNCVRPQSPSIHYNTNQSLPLTKHHKIQPNLTPTTSTTNQPPQPPKQCVSTNTRTTSNAPRTSRYTRTCAPRTWPKTSPASFSARTTEPSASTPTKSVHSARRLIKRKRLVLDGGLVGVRRRILVRRGRLRLKL